jgi:hypothetical protein
MHVKIGKDRCMAGAPNRCAAVKATAELVLRNELDRAASAAVDAIRERVHAIPADRRHVLAVDGQKIKVIETSAVEDALAWR